METRFISDLHIGHANVIKFDERPWANIEEMEAAITERWNSVVQHGDMTYILGDESWYCPSDERFQNFFSKLNGEKYIILGNHSAKKESYTKEIKKKCHIVDVSDYKVVNIGDKAVALSHYPILFYKRDYDKNFWHFYGHVHTTEEWKFLDNLVPQIRKIEFDNGARPTGHMMNVGCMMPWIDYTPRTFEEITKAWEERYNNERPEENR